MLPAVFGPTLCRSALFYSGPHGCFLRMSGSAFVTMLTPTLSFSTPSGLRHCRLVLRCCVWARLPCCLAGTCLRSFRSSVGSGFSPAARHAPSAAFLIPPVRLSVCGLIWPPQAQMSAHSRCRRSLSVRPLRMPALTLFFVGMGGFVRLPDSLLLHQLLGTYRQFSISWQPG